MAEAVDTGLPDVAPISWATRAGGLLFTAHVPIRADGSFETGTFEDQCRLTLENLQQPVERAGGQMRDVAQVIGCSALTVPGMKVEIVATDVLGG